MSYEPKNILIQQASDNEPQVQEYLDACIKLLPKFLEEWELTDSKRDQPVADVHNEEVQDQLYRLKTRYPFVQTFSFAEFRAFQAVVDVHLTNATKRKRGRPKGPDLDANQMRQEVAWIREYYPGARENQLTRKQQWLKSGEWHTVQGNELDFIYIDLALHHNVVIPQKRAKDIFEHIAKSNPFEPTIDLMDACRKEHSDMTFEDAHRLLSSIGTYLLGEFKGEPSLDGQSLRDRFFARFLINMAILARHPGVIPTWIPILIGEQGCGKSQFCRSLIPESHKELFTPITNTLEQLAREQYRLHVGFLLELPEVDSLLIGKKATEWMKNLITSPEDEVRFCYHALPTTLTRRFGFIGTTNREDIFRDGTGSYERRYIPLQIPAGHKIPWEELQNGLASKLWAAADIVAEKYPADSSELKAFSPAEVELLTVWQQNYTSVDPWEDRLIAFCGMRSEFTPSDALTYLDVPAARRTRADIRRVNEIIRKRLGARAKYKQVSRDGQRPWVWQITATGDLTKMTDF